MAVRRAPTATAGALRFGLNRWDWRSPRSFVEGVVRAEAAGVDDAFLPVNPLLVPDPYALFTAAAAATSTIGFGPLLETPALRPAPVAAGSIATLEQAAPGRTILVYGVGDTAVRMLGRRPSRLAELEAATRDARTLLAGDAVEVGAGRPMRLAHARPVPVWIAASGPKSLQLAGRVADGVFLRVGTHPANVETAVAQVRAGMAEAGREPGSVAIGLIVHTVRSQDPGEVRAITRAMAAGFYEYAPALFDPPGFIWNGPPVEELKRQVYPDFHHAADLVAAGSVVDFLPDDVAQSFSCSGTVDDVAAQLRAVVASVPEIERIVPHPVPMPRSNEIDAYARWIGEELKPRLG